MVAVIDEVLQDIKAQIEADFGPSGFEEPSKQDFLDWLHYRARSIPQRFRAVVLSEEVKGAMSRYPAIAQIKYHLANAGDVRPWLTERIRKRKADPRADMLFNDWQITHFHLGAIDKSGRVSRSDDLLFSHITGGLAILIAIRAHRQKHLWTDRKILENLLQTYPPCMERFEVRDLLGSREPWTDAEHEGLRKAGSSAPVQIGNRIFNPGGGLATSGHSYRIGYFSMGFLFKYYEFKQKFITNQLSYEEIQNLVFPIGLAVCLGFRLTFDGRLELWDKARNHTIWASPPIE